MHTGQQEAMTAARTAEYADVSAAHGSADDSLLEDEHTIHRSDDLRTRAEWQLALRIAASKGLCKSSFLPNFLLYICEQHLLGNTQEITEQRIGTKIFHRASNYNPGEDNIVRSYARLLRKRLDEYFLHEGRDEPARLIVPRGGYIPIFERHAPQKTSPVVPSDVADEELETPATAALPATVSPSPTARIQSPWAVLLLGILIGASLASAAWLLKRNPQPRMTRPQHALWSKLFQPDRDTLIVPADSGFGILQNVTGKLADVQAYANGTYFADIKSIPGIGLGNLNDLRGQRYTSVVALTIASTLVRLPEFSNGRSQIRYARGITIEDLKSSNAILLGSSHTNPWVSLFNDRLNFELDYTATVDQSFVLNKHPIAAERPRYSNGTDDTGNLTYGVIDYLPGLDGSGHTLIIQGLNMAATQAAADILFNADVMKPILQKATLPNGDLKSFELLVETRSIAANAPQANIVATRFYPR
jgi:hypothetical protein